MELLRAVFLLVDVDRITSIPMFRFSWEDTWVRHYEKRELYTVKSGYHIALALKLNQQDMGASSSSLMSTIYQQLRKLSIPSKIQTFAWRALLGILPTRDFLH